MTALQAASSQQGFYDKLDELVKSARDLIVTGFGDASPEEATKQHLIEPLLTALGYKRANYDKEFHILDDDVDYLLKDRHPLMFLEAKSLHDPAKNLFKKHQQQVTHYIYNYRRTPPDKLRGEEPINWIVLTNFAQWFFIRVHEEVPSFSFTLDDIVSRREEFWELLALENVVANRIDELYDQRQKADLDKRFLADLKRWRLIIANGFALRNPDLSIDDLTKASQQLLDRFIFCRMLETNRLIEHDTLARRFARYLRLYGDPPTKPFSEVLKESLFAEIKRDFNTELFIRPQLCDQLAIDNIALATVIGDEPLTPDVAAQCGFEQGQGELLASYKHLYGYDFSRMSTDIMGAVYERFLAHKLDKKDGRITIEDTNELRKKEGIYYTPRYIVDYIVAHTVGKKIDPILKEALALLGYKNYRGALAKIRELSQIKVLDAAMGSASFLLRAFDTFVDAYAAYNAECAKCKQAHGQTTGMLFDAGRELPEPVEHVGRLVVTENIFGVDLDEQAVEVAKLNLWMRLMKVEREFIRESVTIRTNGDKPLNLLPTLSNNLKRGNSLIDDPAVAGDAAFNWKNEFPDIMQRGVPAEAGSAKGGGFDCVIGNPPYVLLQDAFRDQSQLDYLRNQYAVASYKVDTYHLFVERGVRLAGPGGYCSMITPANFLTNNYLAPLRRFLLDNSRVDHILILDGGVFHGISVDNAIFVVAAGDHTSGAFLIMHATVEGESIHETSKASISATKALGDRNILFTGDSTSGLTSLWERLQDKCCPLGNLAYVNFGKQLRDRSKYPDDVVKVKDVRQIQRRYKPCYTGENVTRYHVEWNNLACLDAEEARYGGCWDPTRQNAKNKLLTRQVGLYPEFALDTRGYQCLNTIFMVSPKRKGVDPHLLLGVLNSRLLRAYWGAHFYDQRRTFPKIKGTYLERLPISVDDSKRATGITKQIVELAEHAHALSRKRHELPGQLLTEIGHVNRTDCSLAHYLQKDYAAAVTAEILIEDVRRKGFVHRIVVQPGKKHIIIAAEVSDAKDAAPAIQPIVRLTFANPALQQFVYASWRSFLETNARKTSWTTGKTAQPVYDLIVNAIEPLAFFHPAAAANLNAIRDLMKSVAKEVGTSDLAALEQEIADTDKAIDHLVYDLYGLTEDEIRIVEESG
ncbi:MAG TPA: TaqI-like C-terminal specificity domain-containing protein [Verrucomicrobiae bacterium]|nr:TaqI-like C-terminal specificity domain-containing protein [Verrucomicrobiae bacterium]